MVLNVMYFISSFVYMCSLVHVCICACTCVRVQTRGQHHCYTSGALHPTSNLAHLFSLITRAFKGMPVH